MQLYRMMQSEIDEFKPRTKKKQHWNFRSDADEDNFMPVQSSVPHHKVQNILYRLAICRLRNHALSKHGGYSNTTVLESLREQHSQS